MCLCSSVIVGVVSAVIIVGLLIRARVGRRPPKEVWQDEDEGW